MNQIQKYKEIITARDRLCNACKRSNKEFNCHIFYPTRRFEVWDAAQDPKNALYRKYHAVLYETKCPEKDTVDVRGKLVR